MELKEFLEYTKRSYNGLLLPKIYFLHHIYDFFLIYCTNNFPHKRTSRTISSLCRRFQLKEKKILDIGSGLGYNSFYFHSEKNKVTGIELSENYIQYARNRYGRYNIDFIEGDVLEKLNQIEDNSIDFIFCYHFPAHYDSTFLSDSVFTELFFKSVLTKLKKKDGIFYYAFYSTKNPFAHLPVNKIDLEKLMSKLDIKSYEINLIDAEFPMLELIIKAE